MMVRSLLALLLVITAIPFAQAEPLLMPLELTEAAREAGCEPIANFYDRPGNIDPPYLYGYVPGEGLASAASRSASAVLGARP